MSPRARRALFAAATTAFAFGHVLVARGSLVGRPEGELRDHAWVAWVVREALAHGRSPLHTALGGAPDGVALYPLDPLHQAFITLWSGALGLVGAMNLHAAASYFVLVYGAQKLAAGRGALAELTIGALGALSPAFLGPFADTQTEGMAAGWLLLFLGELCSPQPRAARAALWGAILVGTGPYLAHAVAVLAGLLWMWRRLSLRWAAAVLVWSAFLAATMWVTEARPGGALGARAAQMADAARPPRSSPLGVQAPPPLPDTGVARRVAAYPGAAETGPRRHAPWLLGALVVLALREPRARLPAALAVGYALVAAGNRWGATQLDVPTPYDLFWRVYPLARFAWKPAQYAVPATAFALLAAAGAFPLPGPAPGWRRWAAPALAIGAVVELVLRSPTPLPLPAVRLEPRPVWLTLGEGGAVVEYPCRDRSPPGAPPVADVLLGPLWHGRALGESHRGPHDRANARGAHPRLLDALEAAATGRGDDALAHAVPRAAADGFTDLLVLGAVLGEAPTARLARALEASGATRVATPDGAPAWPDGVQHYRLRVADVP